MPFYEYGCVNSHIDECLRAVDSRHDPKECPTCGENMTLVIGATKFDTLHMGTDPAFPTFYKKWGDLQESKNRGKASDANNSQIKNREY